MKKLSPLITKQILKPRFSGVFAFFGKTDTDTFKIILVKSFVFIIFIVILQY